ncbi:MAG: glycosyltransferase family A protein [Sphingomonadaceae bacterium]|nr:glycosyltransferase family A protein [Sphingomonadaceae bacterium]
MAAEAPAPEISAVINLHGEGRLCHASLRSFDLMCTTAAEAGISVERIAILDRPTPETLETFADFNDRFDQVRQIDVGDLGGSRNFAVSRARGTLVATFDGDDLWGREWLVRGHDAVQRQRRKHFIVHPEIVYYFDDSDFQRSSQSDKPAPGSKSFMFRHNESTALDFDEDTLRFNNVYTSNILAPRATLKQFPYIHVDASRGMGVEDWAWNALTVRRGVAHLTAAGTVHLVRVKSGIGSLGARNTASGLLPPLPSVFSRLGG